MTREQKKRTAIQRDTRTRGPRSGERGKGTTRRLLSYVKDSRGGMATMVTSGLLYGASGIVAPMVIARSIDQMTAAAGQRMAGLVPLLGLLLAIYLAGAFCQWSMSVWANIISTRVASRIRGDAFSRMTALPVADLDHHPRGDFLSRLTSDAESVADGFSQVMLQLCSGTVLMLGSMIMMLVIDFRVALAVVIVTPLCFVVTGFINKISRTMYRKQAEATGEVNSYAAEMIAGQTVLRSFGAVGRSRKVFGEKNARLYKIGQKAQFCSALTNPGTRFVNNTSYVLVGMIACFAGIRGKITVGAIAALLSYVLQFAKPVNEFSAVSSQFQNALAGADRLFWMIDREPEDLRLDCPALQPGDGQIDFEDVSFSYSKSKPLIRGLSLQVPAGGKVAIVGPTGAGKTTLVNLLMDFYDLDSGRIVLDSQPISQVRRDSLRRSFGMVLQDSWLFSGTVHDNIAYGMPGASREEVIEAARKAQAHEFIMRLPKGYDTVLSDSAAALSAGEKQLLSISRVILMDPRMLILDEATSSIDTRTERLIQDAFDLMMKGKTAFVIAHRLSTIRNADLILVMKDGAIVQKGPHEELVRVDGLYRTLYMSQYESMAVKGGATEPGPMESG